jgi:hypothetical protein
VTSLDPNSGLHNDRPTAPARARRPRPRRGRRARRLPVQTLKQQAIEWLLVESFGEMLAS